MIPAKRRLATRVHGTVQHQIGELGASGGHPPERSTDTSRRRRTPTRRTQAPRRQPAQTTVISGLARHWHAWSAARTRRAARWQRLARSTITVSTGPAGGQLRRTRFAPRTRPDGESAGCRDCSEGSSIVGNAATRSTQSSRLNGGRCCVCPRAATRGGNLARRRGRSAPVAAVSTATADAWIDVRRPIVRHF